MYFLWWLYSCLLVYKMKKVLEAAYESAANKLHQGYQKDVDEPTLRLTGHLLHPKPDSSWVCRHCFLFKFHHCVLSDWDFFFIIFSLPSLKFLLPPLFRSSAFSPSLSLALTCTPLPLFLSPSPSFSPSPLLFVTPLRS